MKICNVFTNSPALLHIKNNKESLLIPEVSMKRKKITPLRFTRIMLVLCSLLLCIVPPSIADTELDASLSELESLDTTTPTTIASTPNQPTPNAAISTDSTNLTFDELTTTAAPSQTPEPSQEEVSLPMDLPIIGTVNLIPFTKTNPKTGKEVSGMKVYVPNKGKKLVLGPLTLDQGELLLINDEPRYLARATLFGKSATLSIKKASKEKKSSEEEKPAQEESSPAQKKRTKLPSFSRIVFGIKFAKEPTLEIIPGKKAILKNMELILEKNKPVLIVANTNLLGQPVKITFALSKKNTDMWAEFKQPIAFDSIIPQLTGTPAADIQLTSCTFIIKNIVSKPKKPIRYILEGKTDISKVPGIESKDAQEISIKGTYTKNKSQFLLKTKQLNLPDIGTVNNAKIVIISKKDPKDTTNKKYITTTNLLGTMHIRIPEIGEFDTTINASITKKGIILSGKIEQTVRFADIDISNITLKISSIKKSIALIGDGEIKGYKARIGIMRDSKGTITAQAKILEKEIKPFAETHIPEISDISLKNPQFTFEKKEATYEVFMGGTVNLFGVPLAGKLNVKTSDGRTITLLQADAPAHWKLSQGIAQMKGTLFNAIDLEELSFIVSNDEYVDTEKKVTYKKGMNFVAKTTLSGPLVPVAVFTGTDKTSSITISGYIAPDPLNSIFRAAIPNGVNIKNDSVQLGKLELEIAGNPTPTFSLLTTLMVKPSSHDDTLTLTSRISFKLEPLEVALAGTMQGFWQHPFGIQGFEIGNVAAQIAFGAAFPETGVPASIGLAGQMTIGSRQAAMALKIPLAGDPDMVLCGALSKLSIEDLMDIAIKLASDISGKKLPNILPDIGIENMKLYVAPKTTTIGELSFDQGLTVRGVLFIPGFKAFGNITVSSSGLIAQASCTEIKFGPKNAPLLLISRSKEDTTFKNTDKTTQDPFENKKNKACSVQVASTTHMPAISQLVDAIDSSDSLNALDTLSAPTAPDKQSVEQEESLKTARSADIACAPDSTLLTEYNGPTMHIVLNLEQDLSKQGILVSGLFKVAEIFEEEAYFRMDKDGIEFDFETALGKTAYHGKPLLQTCINGKSSGPLTNPDFALTLDFQQYLLSYVKEQTKVAIMKAKEDVRAGVASAKQETVTKLTAASQEASTGIDKAVEEVKKSQDALDAINKKINDIKETFSNAKKDAQKTRDTLDQEIKDLEQKIREKQKKCD